MQKTHQWWFSWTELPSQGASSLCYCHWLGFSSLITAELPTTRVAVEALQALIKLTWNMCCSLRKTWLHSALVSESSTHVSTLDEPMPLSLDNTPFSLFFKDFLHLQLRHRERTDCMVKELDLGRAYECLQTSYKEVCSTMRLNTLLYSISKY